MRAIFRCCEIPVKIAEKIAPQITSKIALVNKVRDGIQK